MTSPRRIDWASGEFLLEVIGRPAILLVWCLVFWGTFYGLFLLYAVATEGATTVFRRALSGEARPVGIANLALAGLAILVWSAVAGVLWRRRKRF